jgi:hypothetical protein
MPSSRRDFLRGSGAIATATVMTSAPGLARAASAASAAGPEGDASAAAATSFEPGLALGPCRLVAVLPVELGALPFELQDPSGHHFVVEVHRRDAGVQGLRPAGSYDVFLRNGGSGATPTDETHGLGAMALASLIAAREAAGRPIPQLSTIVERWSSDPPPLFRSAR